MLLMLLMQFCMKFLYRYLKDFWTILLQRIPSKNYQEVPLGMSALIPSRFFVGNHRAIREKKWEELFRKNLAEFSASLKYEKNLL